MHRDVARHDVTQADQTLLNVCLSPTFLDAPVNVTTT